MRDADGTGAPGETAPERMARIARVGQIAGALVGARNGGHPLAELPAGAGQLSLAEGMEVQREVIRLLGLPIGGWKAGLVPGVRFTYAAVPAPAVQRGPVVFTVPCVPLSNDTTVFVEGEVALRLARDLLPRKKRYGEDEVADAVASCCAAIEIGNPRLANFNVASLAVKMADSMGNGAIIHGEEFAQWRNVDWSTLPIVMTFDDNVVVEATGNGKGSDPLAALVALANARDREEPLRAGQFVITGNRTGLNFAKPGMAIRVVLEGIGAVVVRLA